jgi:hypothetical protein
VEVCICDQIHSHFRHHPSRNSSSGGQQLQGAAMTARLSRELLAYIGRGLKDQERDLLQVGLYNVPTWVGRAVSAIYPATESPPTNFFRPIDQSNP